MSERAPMIVSPYDAELFGHWWFEGIEFIANVFREIDKHKIFKAITPIEYLSMYPQNQVVEPAPSSWGDQGYFDVWLNEGNGWIYRHLHQMAKLMSQYALNDENREDYRRVLNQMLRELLLAQSSDWAFLITTNTAKDYSIVRTKEHISNFFELEAMYNSEINFDKLTEFESKNSIFEFIDYRVFRG